MSAGAFRYTARTLAGAGVTGTLRANSEFEAALDLRRRDLFLTSLQPSRRRPIWDRYGAGRQRSLVGFFRAFATLVACGVTIRRALQVTIAQTGDRNFRESLQSVLADVEGGASLSAALQRRPREFAPLYVAMIQAGESGGVLERVLDRIASMLDDEQALRKRMRATLVYPAVVALTARVSGPSNAAATSPS